MNEFVNLSKNLMRDKWKLINWVTIFELIAFVAIYLLRLVTGGWNGEIMPTYFVGVFAFETGIVSFVGFIMLSRSNEHVFTSNNYRLIPISDTKLYFSNILTTFLAYVYLQILGVVIGNIIEFMTAGGVGQMPKLSGEDLMTMGQFILLTIIGMILIWTGITLVHFLINWIGGFLAFGRQKLVKFILYVVVTFVGLVIFNYTTGSVFKFVYENMTPEGINNLNQFNNVIWISIGVSAIWLVIFTVLNIYFLKRWIETIR
ncbi:hypothetical protein [Companilactobacillus musae]|uniref:hypothetical protein n=1 Tax=Companilactobacillus musae TaxID=1903258 RepID=UPI000E653513|nr:hypothetical protein [Companilactobacillus musae]